MLRNPGRGVGGLRQLGPTVREGTALGRLLEHPAGPDEKAEREVLASLKPIESERGKADGESDAVLHEALLLISSGKPSEARALLADTSRWSDEARSYGRRLGLKGVLNSISHKSLPFGLSSEPDKVGSVRDIIRNRQTSIWGDEFDRGYFEVWLLILELFEKGGLGDNGGRQRVVEDPGKQIEDDKTP